MDRREFLSLAGVSATATTLRLSWSEHSAEKESQGTRRRALMKLGTQMGPTSDEMLQFFARHGVKNICGYPPRQGAKGYWELDDLLRLRERVESYGISLDMLPLPMSSRYITTQDNPNIMLAKSPQRDREIDNICKMIRVAAKAGIPCLKYNLTILGVLRTGRTPGRGGSSYSTWVHEKAKQDPPLTEAGPVPADLMWERISYFLERVIPVTTEYKVRMACHPHDPGVPPQGFRGVTRVLGTVEGLRRFVSTAESDYHGLNFCQGTISAMLQNPSSEIYAVIRHFGARKKIFNVHFRNIRGRRDDFQEVYPDEGDVNMLEAMRAYKEVGYDGMVMPDHVPGHPHDRRGLQAFAFALGYIRALIQAVNAEA
jgi:mannonate dehydratase